MEKKWKKKNYVKQVDDNLVELHKQKQAIDMAVRISYICIAVILFISNFINVFLYGVSEATKKPEFMIMVSISLIWLIIYTYIINKIDSKKNLGYIIAIFVVAIIIILVISLFFTISV